jgi:diguanylate cyclase (GGDEF)-like protein
MPNLRRLSARHGFLAAALILAGVGAWVVWGVQRFSADASWVAHTHAVLAQLDNVNAVRREVISAQRGYLLTRRASDRDQFWQARAGLGLEVERLHALVNDNPGQRAAAAALEPLVRPRLAIAERTIAVFDRAGLPATQDFILHNGSGDLDLRIDRAIAAMQRTETSLLAQRRATSERSARGLLLAALLGIPLSLAILASVYRLLARENAQRRRSELEAGAANLELGRSVQKLERLSGEMAALSRYAGMLQGCTDLEDLFEVTRATLRKLLPDSAGAIYLVRASRDHAEVAAEWGDHRAPILPHPRPQDCWAVRRNQPFACADLARDVHCAHFDVPAGPPVATHCLPLSAQGELMGWLALDGTAPGPLRDAALAQQAAEQFSLALANLRLKDVLRQQSIRDPLTGLFNRRYLEESLAREIARCQRRNLPLVVMMLDLDHFKAFNDLHGHGGGDALLTAFARLLQGSCRAEDIPCRYGGEEFTLILPEADDALAQARARQLLLDTAQLVVMHQGEPLSRVTTSIGIASLPRNGTSAATLMAAADAALYRAKSRGRNQAVVAD